MPSAASMAIIRVSARQSSKSTVVLVVCARFLEKIGSEIHLSQAYIKMAGNIVDVVY